MAVIVEFLNRSIEELKKEDLHSKITLKVGTKYITVNELTKEVVLGDKPTEWIVIRAPTNRRIISLFHQTLGYVHVDTTTKTLMFSKTTPTFFFVHKNTFGMQLI